jgi:hypothetical protein
MIGGIEETSASSKPDPRLDPTRLKWDREAKEWEQEVNVEAWIGSGGLEWKVEGSGGLNF